MEHPGGDADGGHVLGSSRLLGTPFTHTVEQALDFAPAAEDPVFDPAALDLEASTLSRSFHRQKGSSRVEEEVLVSIEPEPPCDEASKLSQVGCIRFYQHKKHLILLHIKTMVSGTSASLSSCGRDSRSSDDDDPSKFKIASHKFKEKSASLSASSSSAWRHD